ncbi:MAG: sensor histidine kinase [Spirochaetota bacterium]
MTTKTDPSNEPFQRALFITAIYTILGGAWILGSDHLATLIAGEAAELAAVQRIKGLLYVALTAGLLFGLIHHALRALRHSEREAQRGAAARHELGAYLNAIIRATPVAIFDLDASARVHSIWNPAAQALFGYAAEEVLGKSPELISQEQWDLIESTRRAVLSGEAVAMLEAELSRKDGSSFPAAVAAAVLDTGEPIVVVTVSDLSELKRTLRRLQDSLEEREVLLREIHHRVKNNLQIVSSLLVLERRDLDESAAVGKGAAVGGGAAVGKGAADYDRLGRALSRVRTIARIHEQLYRDDDLGHVDLAEYLRGLADEIVVGHRSEQPLRFEKRFDAVEVHIDDAIPVGLILHELLVDACERTAHTGEPPFIDVALIRNDGYTELRVSDNGSPTSEEAGLFLVSALTDQIGGTIETKYDDGRIVSLRAVLTSPSQKK